MRAALLLLLFAIPSLCKAPQKAECKSFHFSLSLKEGAGFEKNLGEGFVFRSVSEQQADGAPDWYMTLENAKRPGQDYMWLLNGPMHFNSIQYYGPVFGQTVDDSTRTRSLDFLLNHEDFDKISKLRSEAQWPAPGYDEEKGYAEFHRALAHVRHGNVRLVVKHHTMKAKGQLDSIDLDAEFIVPGDFQTGEIKTQPTQCVPLWVLKAK
jgi:hypothetical protein